MRVDQMLEVVPQPAAGAAEAPAPTCCAVHLQALPGMDLEKMGYVPLLDGKDPERLLRSFQEAPQFSQVPLAKLFRERRGCLQVILLAESGYYAQQAALYLASFAQIERGRQREKERSEDSFWENTGLEGPV